MKKEPRYKSGWWIWDCAYADAYETKSMLSGSVFDKLGGYWFFVWTNKHADTTMVRGYSTKCGAYRALKKAIKKTR